MPSCRSIALFGLFGRLLAVTLGCAAWLWVRRDLAASRIVVMGVVAYPLIVGVRAVAHRWPVIALLISVAALCALFSSLTGFGSPPPVVDSVWWAGESVFAQIDNTLVAEASERDFDLGSLIVSDVAGDYAVLRSQPQRGNRQLVVLNLRSRERRDFRCAEHALSPDGSRLAFLEREWWMPPGRSDQTELAGFDAARALVVQDTATGREISRTALQPPDETADAVGIAGDGSVYVVERTLYEGELVTLFRWWDASGMSSGRLVQPHALWRQVGWRLGLPVVHCHSRKELRVVSSAGAQIDGSCPHPVEQVAPTVEGWLVVQRREPDAAADQRGDGVVLALVTQSDEHVLASNWRCVRLTQDGRLAAAIEDRDTIVIYSANERRVVRRLRMWSLPTRLIQHGRALAIAGAIWMLLQASVAFLTPLASRQRD